MRILIAAALLGSASSLFGQNPCGYKGFSPWLKTYQQQRELLTEHRGDSDPSHEPTSFFDANLDVTGVDWPGLDAISRLPIGTAESTMRLTFK